MSSLGSFTFCSAFFVLKSTFVLKILFNYWSLTSELTDIGSLMIFDFVWTWSIGFNPRVLCNTLGVCTQFPFLAKVAASKFFGRICMVPLPDCRLLPFLVDMA